MLKADYNKTFKGQAKEHHSIISYSSSLNKCVCFFIIEVLLFNFWHINLNGPIVSKKPIRKMGYNLTESV